MTAWNSSSGSSHDEGLDVFTAERLFGGATSDATAPEVRGVAMLLGALRQPATATELQGEVEALEAMIQAVAAHDGQAAPAAKKADRKVLGKLITTKVLGAAAGMLLMGGAAAAATGQVPDVWPHFSPAASEAPATISDNGSTTSTTDPTGLTDSAIEGGATEGELAPTMTGPADVTTTTSTVGQTPAGAVPGTDADPDDASGHDAGTDEVVCADGNHGATVNSVARDEAMSGRAHGAAVSEAARSDCGKAPGDDGQTDDDSDGGEEPSADSTSDQDDDALTTDDGTRGANGNGHTPSPASEEHGRSPGTGGNATGKPETRSQTR